MVDSEKLKRHMDSLNRLIRLDWVELEPKNLSPADRMEIRRHVTLLRDELTERWSWFPGQNGGLAKVDSGFDYAAKFSCRISIA
jgi:hypothetical protein